MAHLYIPLDGVPIVPSPPGPGYIAADGWVVFSLSDRRFYAYNMALGVWQQAGGGIVVADTDSIDLTETSGTLSADVLISSDSAPVGNVKATITIQPAPNPGLLAVVAESDIQALFGVTDTDSIDLTYSAGQTSADLLISTNAADAGYQLVDLNIETTTSKGLRAQISDASIQAALTVTDSDSIDLTYSSGAMSGDVKLSAASADLGKQLVALDIQTGATAGLRAQINDSQITSLFAVTDTDSIDFSYSAGSISGSVRLSANAADASYQKVDLNIENSVSQGIRAQVANTAIQAALSVTDTDSIDMSYLSGAFAADFRISPAAADAGYTIVGLSIQSGVSKGVRAQVQNSAIQGLFSATAPILYSAGAFSFDNDTTTLTKYLLLTGGTMTGAIVSAIPYSNLTVVSSMLQPSATAFANVTHLQSTTLTFDATKGECFKFSINAETHAGLEVCAYYKHGLLTILTDQENKYQEADSGSGFYISKGNNTGVITIKQRLGGTHKILITIKEGVLLSATAWA